MLYSTDSANACLRRSAYAAAAFGVDEFGSDLLLVALSEDATVAGALGGAGVQTAALRATVGFAEDDDVAGVRSLGMVSSLPDRRLRQPDPEVVALMADAEAAAASREHFFVEPGHLLLAIARWEGSRGCRLLCAIGGDVACICDHIERALPAEETSEEDLAGCLRRYPPLPARESRRLAGDLALRNRTRPLLRLDEDCLTGEQRLQLHARRRLSPNAGLRLHRHHVHVVMQAATERAQSGHRLQYAFNVAEQAQLRATTHYTNADEPFAQFARRAIDVELRRLD